MLLALLQKLLQSDTDRKLDELNARVDLLMHGVAQLQQLMLLQLQAMGVQVKFLTPEEAAEEAKKMRETAGKGLN